MIENRPLAERMRPSKLSDYISQQHLVGEKGAILSVLLVVASKMFEILLNEAKKNKGFLPKKILLFL